MKQLLKTIGLTDKEVEKVYSVYEYPNHQLIFSEPIPEYRLGKRITKKLLTFRKSMQAVVNFGPTAIRASSDAYDYLYPLLFGLSHEHFVVIALNKSNRVIDHYLVNVGVTDACLVDKKRIFRFLLLNNACAFILAHNHPSGNKALSDSDKKFTNEFKQFANYIGIQLLDSIVFTDDGYYSMADDGLI